MRVAISFWSSARWRTPKSFRARTSSSAALGFSGWAAGGERGLGGGLEDGGAGAGVGGGFATCDVRVGGSGHDHPREIGRLRGPISVLPDQRQPADEKCREQGDGQPEGDGMVPRV